MLRRRWNDALAAGRKAVVEANATADPAKPRTPGQRHALIHLGCADSLDGALARHLGPGANRRSEVIVASNTITQALILRPDVIFEFLPLDMPPPARIADAQEEALRYLFDRITHVVTVWNVHWCIWAGDRAPELYPEAMARAPALASMSALDRQGA